MPPFDRLTSLVYTHPMHNMKRTLLLVCALVLSMSVIAMDVQAKRFGGGRSFGSRKSYSSPSKSTGTSGYTQKQQSGTTGTKNGVRRPGMGLFGGLLAGTLLGSLFFGGGFMGPGLLDMLLIGGGIFLLMRFMRRRSTAATPGSRNIDEPVGPREGADRYARAQAGWDHLSSGQRQAPPQPEVNTPSGFDPDEFLRGAKMVYNRLQQAWDARDLGDIREFTTDEVYDEISRQAAADPGPSTTEILLVNARLLEAKEVEGKIVATVYYDVMLREDQTQGQPSQVREVWHFSRPVDDTSAHWKLEGMQQLED